MPGEPDSSVVATWWTLRILFIVNSVASSVTARRRVVIHKALSADHDVTLAETSRRGHATRLAQSAARDELRPRRGARRRRHPQRGGQRAGRHPTPRSPPCPAARPTSSPGPSGLPDDSGRRRGGAARRDRRRVASAGSGSASVDGRYFLFHCGIGFDAAVVEQVERRGPVEALGRPPALRLRRHRHLAPPHRPHAPRRCGSIDAARRRSSTTGFFTDRR